MPAARLLVDTGVIFAAMDSRDPWHAACTVLLKSAPRPMLTTQAVIAELFWLCGGHLHVVSKSWEILRSGAFALAEIKDGDLAALNDLMIRYASRRMDFADATLVHVAKRERIRDILTIDHSDFETYRIGRKTPFRILPRRDQRNE
jgi:hypothetical protein